MRKFFLSAFIIVTLVMYSIYQRSQNPEVAPVVIPKSTTNNSSDSQQNTANTNPIQDSPTPIPIATPQNIPSNAPTPTPIPTSIPTDTPIPTQTPRSGYKDGNYTGNLTDAYYGNVQVQTTISGGKITDVQFLQYPSDRSTSVYINSQAMPYLKQEAIQAQSAQVNIVSGATFTSQAFIQSLQSALDKAKS